MDGARGIAAVIVLASALDAQVERPAETESGQRRALWGVDAGAGRAAWTSGLPAALAPRMSDSVIALIEGAPVMRGRANVERLLGAQRALPIQMTWEPQRVFVSRDLTLGVTFGTTVVLRAGAATPTFGRYVSVWRRNRSGAWELAAHVQNGLLPNGATLVESMGTVSTDPRDPFADADRAFAQMARDSTAPPAFGRFAAPDAVTFGGPEFNVGPSTIRRRMTENGAGASSWRWWPVATIAAASGDLGATVGEAEITPPRGDAFVSKYLTVWQQQPDGSIRYVVDAGNARPRR